MKWFARPETAIGGIRISRFFCMAFAVMLCALASTAPRAASVLPLYLDEIIDTSAVAFEGTCTGNRVQHDDATGLVITYTTFAVSDVLKGGVGATYTIKQVGGTVPGENLHYRFPGVPSFTVGEEYVVFLAGVSSAGFSSPIGLAQGRFVVQGAGVSRKVSNGRDFKDMTSRIAAHLPAGTKARMQQLPGPVRDMGLDDFKQMVRDYLGAKR